MSYMKFTVKNTFNWRNLFTAIFLIVGVIAMYVIIHNYSFKAIFDTYRNFDPLFLGFYLLAVTSIFFVLTWRWDVILKSRKIRIPFIKLFCYRIIGIAINFFTPGPRVGGEPTQASLLSRHNVEFTEGLSTIMIDKIIDTSISGILFVVGIILVMLYYSIPQTLKIILVITGIIFISLIALFFYRMLTHRHFFLHLFKFLRIDRIKNATIQKLEKKIEEIELIMIDFYTNDKKAFMQTIGISILSWIVMFFEYTLATRLLGISLGPHPFTALFFIIAFIGVAVLFPIPMAVGVLEAGQLSAFAILGFPGSAGIALAFLVRMKDITWGLIGLILLAIFGFSPTKIVKTKYKERKQIIRKKQNGSVQSPPVN